MFLHVQIGIVAASLPEPFQASIKAVMPQVFGPVPAVSDTAALASPGQQEVARGKRSTMREVWYSIQCNNIVFSFSGSLSSQSPFFVCAFFKILVYPR